MWCQQSSEMGTDESLLSQVECHQAATTPAEMGQVSLWQPLLP